MRKNIEKLYQEFFKKSLLNFYYFKTNFKRMRLDSENREKAEIAEENERRLAEKLKQKDEEGIKRNMRMRMQNVGELGECEMVELLNPLIGKGEKKRIYKLSKFKSLRSSIHKMASEWSAWDQVLLFWLLKFIMYMKKFLFGCFIKFLDFRQIKFL